MVILEAAELHLSPEPKPKEPTSQKEKFSLTVKGEVLKGFDIVSRFWVMAEEDGAIERFLSTPPTRRLQGRNLNITRSYIEGLETTKTGSGKKYGVDSREGSRKIIKDTLQEIHRHASKDLQKLFPADSLNQKKSKSIHILKEPSGKNSTENLLRRHAGLVADLLDPNQSYEQRQTSLDQIKGRRLVTFLRNQGVLRSLYKSMLTSGIRMRTRSTGNIAELLKQNGIAVGKISQIKPKPQAGTTETYYFFAAADSGRAEETLANFQQKL